jgi:hypothetical protein
LDIADGAVSGLGEDIAVSQVRLKRVVADLDDDIRRFFGAGPVADFDPVGSDSDRP